MDSENGYILIGTVSAVLLVFLFGFFTVLLIYRKRKLEHLKEMEILHQKFANQLLQTQLEVQQQTMQHIGREIHDNVGQQLTLAALYVQQIDHEKKYPQIGERIVAVSNIINESLSDLRSLSKSLTDDYIAHTDLVALLKNEAQKVGNAGVCTVQFTGMADNINTSYAVKSIVLRIVQEFLQNSLKHAACTNIGIQVAMPSADVMVTVSDNGKGFLENEASGKGIGLLNIRQRAEAIGASVHIESYLHQGTKMQLLIPADKISI